MKEWHLRQEIFHKLYTQEEIGDSLESEIIIEEWDSNLIVQRALDYPIIQTQELYYPGKSYAVAITYALLLKKEFNENVLDVLNDPRLLFGNDPYFKTYDEASEIYDKILENFPKEAIEKPVCFSKNFQKTHEYFYLEFLLHEKTSCYFKN